MPRIVIAMRMIVIENTGGDDIAFSEDRGLTT
jgi:hypothetical protein